MPDWDREYDEAVERQNLIRDLAFAGDLSRQITERIGPFEVLPMNMRHFINLRLIGSPFICGGSPTPDALIAFLWVLSPQYSIHDVRGKNRFSAKCRRVFGVPKMPLIRFPFLMRAWSAKAVRRLQAYSEILAEVEKYREESILDSPGGSSSPMTAPFYSDAAGYCYGLCAAFGWTVEYAMACPLKIGFQLMKIVMARESAKAGKKPTMFNRLSDGVTGRMLDADNARN